MKVAGVKIQKDPEIEKLAANAFAQISKIAVESDVCSNYFDSQPTVQFVSFEQALQELVDLKNNKEV